MIDTHAHLIKEYYQNLDEMINNYKDLKVINCGTSKTDNQEILEMCDKYASIYGSLGIHPHNVAEFDAKFQKFLEENLEQPKIVAVGEIGLDYYYNVNKEEQKKIFIKQLEIAKRLDKPVIIHSRNAFEDTYNILAKYPQLKKVLHCFSYGLEEAEKFLKINCVIGVNGIITFDKSDELKEVVKNVALENILVETDSPYLAPVPYRGKKNDSSKLGYIIEEIAKIKNLPKPLVIRETTQNAIEIFDLKQNKW